MKQIVSEILKSNYFFWPAMVVTIGVAGVVFYFSTISDEVVFPNRDHFKYDTYTDQAEGGDSYVLDKLLTDSVFKLDFRLDEEFYSPYVGFSITPRQAPFLNIKRFNEISLKLKGKNIERIGVSLYTPFSSSSGKIESSEKEALYHSYLNISEEKKLYNIPIKRFSHPEWWKDLHHISEAKEDVPDKSKILHVNIGSAYTPTKDDNKTLEIFLLSFSRNNRSLFTVLGIVEVGVLLFLFFGNYVIMARMKRPSRITVFYKPLEVQTVDASIEKFFEYINHHYHNSQLSLELVSRDTSLTPRQITNAIHENFNCNFKTYINGIRINESKRLLEKTDLNIGEIAFKVGFNSQSHFNRVFKNEMNISPTQYREKLHS